MSHEPDCPTCLRTRARRRDGETSGHAADVQGLVRRDRLPDHVDRRAGGVAFEDRTGDRELQIIDRAAETTDVERRGADAKFDVAAAVAYLVGDFLRGLI